MKGISINGKKLHKVMMPLVPYSNSNSVVSLCYPKHRIEFEQQQDLATLIVPTKLAVEIYRVGILPQDESQEFSISISGKTIGCFKVIKFLYPNNHDDNVIIRLHKQ
jgi:hypothetical protein